MPSPPASALLDLWEQARHLDAPRRALHLLSFALPGTDPDALADFDLGQRDWYLLRLHQAVFGSSIEAQGQCPHCGANIEVSFDTRQVQAQSPLPPAPDFTDAAGHRYRLPTSRDLLAIAHMADIDAADQALLRRCARDGVAGVDVSEVDRGLSALAAERQLRLSLDCELCQGAWTLDFDPAAFLWEELQARAMHLLDDVHRFAVAYGWSEAQVLALGETRRAAYLERIG